MSDLSAMFPIMGINGLCEDSEAGEGVQFAIVDHIVLNIFLNNCRPVDGMLLFPI